MKKLTFAALLVVSMPLAAAEIGPVPQAPSFDSEITAQAATYRLVKNVDLASLVQIAFVNEEIRAGRAGDTESLRRVQDEAIRRRQSIEADLRGLRDESQAKISADKKRKIFFLDSIRSQLSKIPGFGAALDYTGQQSKSYLEGQFRQSSNADLNRSYSEITESIMQNAPALVREAQRLTQENPELRSLYDSLLIAHTGSSLFQSPQQISNDPTQADFVNHVRLAEVFKALSAARDPSTGRLRTDLSEKSRQEITQALSDILQKNLRQFSDEEKSILEKILAEQKSFKDESQARDERNEKNISAILADIEEKNKKAAEENLYQMKRAGIGGLISILSVASSAVDPESARAVTAVGQAGLEMSDALRNYQLSLDLPGLGTALSAANVAALAGSILSSSTRLISALTGSSAEALILAEIRRIHDELRAIKTLIEKHFGRLEDSMERNYVAMLDGFQQLQDKANRSDQKIDQILLRFGHLGMRLNQMESSIENQIRVLAERQNLERILDVVKFTRPEKLAYSLSRSQFNEKMDSMAKLAIYDSGAKTYKLMSGLGETRAEGPRISIADLDTKEDSPQLAAELPRILESLPQYLAGIDNKMYLAGDISWNSFYELLRERCGGLAWSRGCQLPNIEIWAEGVQLYTELGRAWRPYMLSKDRASEIDEMLDIGRRHIRMSEVLTRRSDDPLGHNKALFATLFAAFEKQRESLAQLESSLIEEFDRRYVDGMPLFGDDFLASATRAPHKALPYRSDLDVLPCSPDGLPEFTSWGHRQPDFRPEQQGWTTAYGGKGGEPPTENFRARLRDLNFAANVPAEIVALARLASDDQRNLRFCYDTIGWVGTGSKEVFYRGENDAHEKGDLIGESPFPKGFSSFDGRSESAWVVAEEQYSGYLQIGVKVQLILKDKVVDVGQFKLKRSFADGKKPYYSHLRKALAVYVGHNSSPPNDPRFSKLSDRVYIRTEHGLVGRYETTFKDFATQLDQFTADAFETNPQGWPSLIAALDAKKSSLRSRFFDQLEGSETHFKARRNLLASAKYLEAILQFAMPSSVQADEFRPFIFGARRLSDSVEQAFAKRSTTAGSSQKLLGATEIAQANFSDLRTLVLDRYFATHEDGSLKHALPVEENRLAKQSLRKLESFKNETQRGKGDIENAVKRLREEIQRLL